MSELWHGFRQEKFLFEGREAILVFPNKADEQKNWTLKTEYWDDFPMTEIRLLEEGFHAAYLKNTSRFAPVSDCDAKARFADFLHEKYGLCEKCVPVGMSCGGACAVTFAGMYPEKVKCMFLDAPVLNYFDFPGRIGDIDCEAVWEKEFVKTYPEITRAKLASFPCHPLCYIDIIKEHKIPIIMLYGTQDTTIDYNRHGKLLELEYDNAKELLTVIPRSLQGHHPHGLLNDDRVVHFLIEHSRN